MLGNLSLLNNSIFLSVRWIAVLCLSWLAAPVAAQTALRSQHFIFYSNASTVRQAELGLSRLEELRAVILAIHGPDWAPERPLRIWLPRNAADWMKIASDSTEEGVFLSSGRNEWIVLNPAATSYLEVLSHEYMHAVLHRTLPNLPTWFEEGICEYYSTVALRTRIGGTAAIVGRPPGERLKMLRGIDTITLNQLETGMTTTNAYALAWAAAYHLWPEYRPGQTLPKTIPAGPYPMRSIPIQWQPPVVDFSALTPIEISELEVEFLNQVPRSGLTVNAPAAKAESIFLEGLRLSDSGKSKESIPLLELACRLRPSNSSWWHALAFAAKEAADVELARQAAAKALATALNPQEKSAAEAIATSLR